MGVIAAILLVVFYTNIVSIVMLVFQPLNDDSICPVYDPLLRNCFTVITQPSLRFYTVSCFITISPKVIGRRAD